MLSCGLRETVWMAVDLDLHGKHSSVLMIRKNTVYHKLFSDGLQASEHLWCILRGCGGGGVFVCWLVA